MTRAAAYVRVSTGRQAEKGLSLSEQERRVRAYADTQGWTLDDVYVERGVSGRKDERPELRRLLGELDRFDRVLVPKLDRLGRSSRHLLEVCDEFERADVGLVSLEPPIDTTTPAGRLLRTVLAAVAEFESEMIGDRTRAVTEARARSGRPHGGPAPYGYRHDGGLQIVPHEAEVARRIFREWCDGRSQKAIARGLNADGIPTPGRTKRTDKSGAWSQPVIARILSNPVYIGKIRHKGEVYDGEHEAIIDAETFETATRLRDASARTKGRHGRPSAGSHLFVKGMLRCGECGSSMIPRTIRARSKTGEDYAVYLCSGRVADVESCGQEPVKRETIDSAVVAYFDHVGLDLEALRETLASELDSRRTETRALREQAEKDERQASERLARVRGHYQEGRIEPEDWSEQREQLESELDAARAKLDRLRAQESELSADPFAEVEEAVLERLALIRGAIAGKVRDAETLENVRARLREVFYHFTLHEGQIEPTVRTDLIPTWQDVRGCVEQVKSFLTALREADETYEIRANDGLIT